MDNPIATPRRQHYRVMTESITARSATDMLSLVPYLLGFHISEGGVVILCSGRNVELTMRFDPWMYDAPRLVQSRIEAVVERCDDPRLFLAYFGSERQEAEDALAIMESAVDPGLVLDSVRTDGQRWWSRLCTGQCCPPEGTPCDPASAAAASAVLAGSVALGSRRELERLVEGPSLVQQSTALATLVRLQDQLQLLAAPERPDRMRELVARGIGRTLGESDALEMALLATDIEARDAAWLDMGLATASAHLALWQQVVAATPDRWAVAPLCLMAAAAWLDGNGALMGCCLARAEALDPDYSMLDLLQQIHLQAAPPSMWTQMGEVG